MRKRQIMSLVVPFVGPKVGIQTALGEAAADLWGHHSGGVCLGGGQHDDAAWGAISF